MSILPGIESLNRSQLIARKCHPVNQDGMAKAAHDRLITIHKDDCDELWSLRVQGKPRIWAIPSENVMHVLWWDPEHEVYPSLID